MTAYSQLFDIGTSFDAFVATGLEAEIAGVHRARQALADTPLDEPTLQRLVALKGTYHLLAAGEMWCPDCQLNLTALDYLCQVQPRVSLAIVTKARAEHGLRERLGLEKVSIPLVVALDDRFEPVGLFIEQPQAVTHGDSEIKAQYRSGQWLQATITEVLALLEHAERQR